MQQNISSTGNHYSAWAGSEPGRLCRSLTVPRGRGAGGDAEIDCRARGAVADLQRGHQASPKQLLGMQFPPGGGAAPGMGWSRCLVRGVVRRRWRLWKGPRVGRPGGRICHFELPGAPGIRWIGVADRNQAAHHRSGHARRSIGLKSLSQGARPDSGEVRGPRNLPTKMAAQFDGARGGRPRDAFHSRAILVAHQPSSMTVGFGAGQKKLLSKKAWPSQFGKATRRGNCGPSELVDAQ